MKISNYMFCKPAFIVMIFTVLNFFNSQAQEAQVIGKVFSESSALDGVIVKATNENIEKMTKSNSSGEFTFSNIPSGRWVFEFERDGFEVKKEILTLTAGEKREINVSLIVDPTLFEEIAIVGKQAGLTTKTPYNVSRLDAKEVVKKGQPSGIMGIVREEPGVSGAEMGHGIVKPFIRGLGFSRVATIYQSNKLENHQWGADHGLGVNDLGIASVDLIKGPASLIYGSGALGGVLILKDDEVYKNNTVLSGNFGSTVNSVSGGVRSYGSIGKSFENGAYLAAEGAYENHADYFDGDNRLIGNSRFNSYTIRAHAGYEGEKFQNKVSYTHNVQNLGIIEEDEMEEGGSLATNRSDRSMQLPFQNVTDHIITYKQSIQHSEKWKSYADVSWHYNERQEIEDDFDEIDLGLNQHHIFYNLRMTNKSEKLNHVFGLQGSLVDMKNMLEAEEILFPNAFYFENGGYYVGTYSHNRHTIQGGLRLDYRPLTADANQENIVEEGYVLPGEPDDRKLDLTFFGFTGSLGYSYELNEKNRLKINASSGFRSPDLAELLSNGPHPGTNRFEEGNINFNREQSFQGDISWLRSSKYLNVQASVFANYVDNYIFFMDTGDTTDNGLNIWEFRQTEALLYGGELSFEYRPFGNNNLKIRASGNILRGFDLNADDNLTFVPADQIRLKASYRPIKGKPLNIFVENRYVFEQNRPGIGEMTTPSYNLFNSGVSYEFNFGRHHLTLGVTAYNLFNEVYVDHISILRAFDVTHPGRNIMGNIQWRF